MVSQAWVCKLVKSNESKETNDVIQVSSSGDAVPQELNIAFQRTVRVPDNQEVSALPPDLGRFPLYPISQYAHQLPADMVAKGGVFFPMYRKYLKGTSEFEYRAADLRLEREAMWIRLGSGYQFAIKIYTGGVNAISGESSTETIATKLRRTKILSEGKSVQDYLVTPQQYWLDGIACKEGKVRQFVAMPSGSGYSVEAQLTGEEVVGGLQFEITPSIKLPNSGGTKNAADTLIYVRTLTGKVISLKVNLGMTILDLKNRVEEKEGIPPEQQRIVFGGILLRNCQTLFDCKVGHSASCHLILNLRGGGSGLGPIKQKNASAGRSIGQMSASVGGMIKQSIEKDGYDPATWDRNATITFNVQIIDSESFQQVTGRTPPLSPITAQTYASYGLPFYDLPEETSTIKGDFDNVLSVKQLDDQKAGGTTRVTRRAFVQFPYRHPKP